MFHYLLGSIYGMQEWRYEPSVESVMSSYMISRSTSAQKYRGTGEQKMSSQYFVIVIKQK